MASTQRAQEMAPPASLWWMRWVGWRRHIPEPAGSDPEPIGPRVSAPVRNWPRHWPIAPVTVQGSPQVSEPGESRKEGSPISCLSQFFHRTNNCPETAQNCAESAENSVESDLGPDFIGNLVPDFQLRLTDELQRQVGDWLNERRDQFRPGDPSVNVTLASWESRRLADVRAVYVSALTATP